MDLIKEVEHSGRTIRIYSELLTYQAMNGDHHVKQFVAKVSPSTGQDLLTDKMSLDELITQVKARIDAGMM